MSNKLSYDFEHVLVIRRRLYNGEPTTWEYECTVDSKFLCEGTAPTFYGCVDSAMEVIDDIIKPTYDANDRGER